MLILMSGAQEPFYQSSLISVMYFFLILLVILTVCKEKSLTADSREYKEESPENYAWMPLFF